MENELWLPVNGYEGFYEVSNIGRVRSTSIIINSAWNGIPHRRMRYGKILKPIYCLGYFHVDLCMHGIRTKSSIHRIVATAFIPNPENKPYINHINAIRNDNRVENLEWCTQQENIQHAYKLGLVGWGEDSSRGLLTQIQADEIRKLLSEKKLFQHQIAKLFGVKQSTISKINLGKTYTKILHLDNKNCELIVPTDEY